MDDIYISMRSHDATKRVVAGINHSIMRSHASSSRDDLADTGIKIAMRVVVDTILYYTILY